MASDPIAAPPASAYDDDTPEPPRLRLLRRLVTLLLMVLIAGVLTVVIALLLKLKEADFSGGAGAPAQSAIPGLAPGERLVDAAAGEGRILLTLEASDGGRRVVVLDAGDFRPLAALQDGAGER